MSFNLDDLGTPSRAGNSPRRTPTYASADEIPSNHRKPTIDEIRRADKMAEEMEPAETTATSKPLRVSQPSGMNFDTDNVREVSSFDIAPAAPQEPINAKAVAQLFGPLDDAVQREKQRITELQDQLINDGIKELEDEETAEAVGESSNDYESNDTDTEYVDYETIKKVIHVRDSIESREEDYDVEENNETTSNITISRSFDDALDDEVGSILSENESDDESDAEDTAMNKRSLDDMREVVKHRISPFSKKLDLTKFTVAKTPKSVSEILRTVTTDIKTSNWVLPNAGTVEVFSPLSAIDINNLDVNNHNKTRLNAFRTMYKTIYDHILTPHKPDFEKWIRMTLFHDMDHLYFGLYLATFGDSAFFNPICEKKTERNSKATGCGYQFVSEHKPMDYVKFRDDEAKAKFEKLMHSETYSNNKYNVQLCQISDNYAFALRMPSLYNVIFEAASLSADFTEKYSDMLEVFSYIDDIYFIDRDTNNLIPIKYDIDKKSQPKTTVNKIRAYNEIYKRLSADEQSELMKNIHDIENEHDIGITYITPSTTCPECGNVIPEQAVSPIYLLFTRHRLGRIQSM